MLIIDTSINRGTELLQLVDVPIVQWRTAQDERVYPICFPLEDMKWSLDSPDIPIP